MLRRRAVSGLCHELPSGYIRCNYLMGSGIQWIKTNVSTNDYNCISATFEIYNDKRIGALCGSHSTGYPINSFNMGRLRILWLNRKCDIPSITSAEKHLLSFGRKDNGEYFAELDDVSIVTSNDHNTIGAELTILKGWGGIGSAKIYDFRVVLYGNLVLNAIPALDMSGRPCMYDTVTKQTFYNQGTGEFGYELMDGTYVAPV